MCIVYGPCLDRSTCPPAAKGDDPEIVTQCIFTAYQLAKHKPTMEQMIYGSTVRSLIPPPRLTQASLSAPPHNIARLMHDADGAANASPVMILTLTPAGLVIGAIRL